MRFLVIPLLLLQSSCALAAAQDSKKPNILFIAIDDLNDYISPLANHPGIKTPNFDRLAKRSVTFANAHCAAPACHPSRVAVMTGVHPSRSGIYRNSFGAHGPRWRDESPVLKDAVVLSQHFKNNGYHAAGGGKIFHTLQWTPGDSQNDPAAWSEYRGDPLDPISKDWPRPASTRGQNQNKGFIGRRPLSDHLFGAAPLDPAKPCGDALVTDWAIAQLGKTREKPLFLALGLFRPHIPWEVPQKWFDLHPLETIQLPKHLKDDLSDAHSHGRERWHQWVTQNKQWKQFMRGYLASISYVDNELGRLLDALESSPKNDNTIVVLWSDHGFHIGEKKNWEKFTLWNQATRVPCFIHAPGLSKDGLKSQQAVTLTDLYPTLCELAGLPIPKQCDGISLVPQLKNPATPKSTPAITSYQFGKELEASHALIDSRYRFIRYGNGFEELYDTQKDPDEFTNRIDDPELTPVRKRFTKLFPKSPAKQVPPAHNSPYNRKKPAR
ncbi:MAG: arylsulfatase A-like enzyme [Akkermansiaceae bacterium]|jgi:arylsulfatase A-like enzyme